MTYSKSIAIRVMQLLMKHDMSQYKLLKITGIPQSTWQNIIKEKQSDIKMSTIDALASAFNLSIREFFDDKIFDNRDIGD